MDDEKSSGGPTSRVPTPPHDVDTARNLAGQRHDSPPQEPISQPPFLVPGLVAGGPVTRRRAREIFHSGQRSDKVKLLSLLMCYAEWDELWGIADESTARRLFPHLDLPPNLRRAWARYLDVPTAD